MPPIQTGAGIVEKTMSHLLPAKFDGITARVQLLATGLQESDFVHRCQIGGPARSYWGFEQGGGIEGVLKHPASSAYARSVCGLRAVAPVASDVYGAFLTDDQLACAFARLLLWTDQAPLPVLGDREGAWQYYLRNWRPGRPRREHWDEHYVDATNQVLSTCSGVPA
ncbi:hypothetical protein LQ772_06720 [Frateuria edaphi]|uniref:hypothetical protein n=1 Tax=Frateuria edaphi TaxID=2898793 RepID=UPI001E45307F|nr:hypothetical protein [Frateuria edaphi]UGB46978.1 hypothetical protein LQ772_06720 [Frateuria edaphi]